MTSEGQPTSPTPLSGPGFEARIESLGGQLKRARVVSRRNPDGPAFWMFCDEAAGSSTGGGSGSAPTPMMYFTASVGF